MFLPIPFLHSLILYPWAAYKQRNATSIPTTRAPIEPAATCDEPLVGGADVEAGGAEEDEAVALELLAGVVIGEVSTSELLLGDDNELVGTGTKVEVEVTSGVVSGGGGGAADVVTVDGDGSGGGGGALPVGVTWICPSVCSLTGT